MLHFNAEKAIVAKKGDLYGYVTVWYHHEGIAKILSLNSLQKKYKVTYDSSADSSANTGFILHKAKVTNCVFTPLMRAILLWC